ncbi:MFS general substrate transporter [Aspergillus sclerotiicarbonarius CBS 121057]|uniref:MFS general substrate transporter n=1 Tax=Aspergillus sclerotiicarbonarius (strain CBS 121057 / IBT 28362) TaxID=1448318 RepID=A0A319EK35_ASPSB|nr:MFS general substrate transporter [Aspergillus sclerotiicarbonarius CBS 121057]
MMNMKRPDHTKSTSEHVESLEDGPVAAQKQGQLTTFHPAVDPALEKRVIRKIDMMVIPFICITYLITYIDKAMLGYSAVFGLKEGLHLHGTEYSWLGSMFYFGYLAFEYPTTFVMQKIPVSKWLSVNLFLWGGYTVEEQPIRIGWWSTFLGVANSFGGLLAFGVGQIKGSMQSWQYQFIFIGAISCIWAIFMFFTLAEHPSTAPWLKEEEKEAAVRRLGARYQGANHREIKKYQILEALTDPKTWLFFLCGVSTQVVNGAASNFGSLIIEGFGYSNLVTTLFQIPYGTVILVSNVSAMYLQRWLPGQKRCLVAIIYVCPALAGAVGIHTISRQQKVSLLVCYWLTGTYTASFAMVMSLITANTGGSTKRTVVNALFFVSYCVGNIVGPFSFKSNEAPTYTSGIVAMLVAYCVEIFLLLAFAAYAVTLNRDKEQILHSQGMVLEDATFQNLGIPVDQTDKEDIFFRYSF